MLEAIERVQGVTAGLTLESFEADWQAQWLVTRGIEIVSEASRHLPDEMKARHPEIPWRKVADIGNKLRHEYERIAADILWKVARDELRALEEVCRREISANDRSADSGR